MSNRHFTFSVVGGGAVGSAIAAYYKTVKVFDKYKDSDPIEDVAKADFIFIAVPTPFQEGPDLSEMDDAIANTVNHLTNLDEQVVIIKSTVIPGTTDAYQKKYPRVNFIFNPEFLTERVAIQEFAKPDKQLVGFTAKSRNFAEKVMEILPDAPYKKILPAKSAEMAKYGTNSYYAFKVIFGNGMYDFCQKFGIDYDEVREGLVADRRIIDSHFDVMHGGFRGYGGKCLPKDVQSLVWLAKKHRVDLSFIEKVIQINKKLIREKSENG